MDSSTSSFVRMRYTTFEHDIETSDRNAGCRQQSDRHYVCSSSMYLVLPSHLQTEDKSCLVKSGALTSITAKVTGQLLRPTCNQRALPDIHGNYKCFCKIYCIRMVGSDSSVGIVTHYGLVGPGIESRCGRVFLHPSRPAMGPPSFL
jgi:hypothetical protein